MLCEELLLSNTHTHIYSINVLDYSSCIVINAYANEYKIDTNAMSSLFAGTTHMISS